MNYDVNAVANEESDHEEPVVQQQKLAPKQNNNHLNFGEDPIISGQINHGPTNSSPRIPQQSKNQHASFPSHDSHGSAGSNDVRRPVNRLPPLETVNGATKSQGYDMLQMNAQQQQNQAVRQPVHQQHSNQKQAAYDDLLQMQDFEDSDNYDEIGGLNASPPQLQQQYVHNTNNNQQHHESPQHQQLQMNFDQQQQVPNIAGGGQDLEGGDEEEESVYIKDNVVMRRIQIEGEDQEYLMDPEGTIYDMQGNFIGTANANELEEMEEEGNPNTGGQQNILDDPSLMDEQQLIN